MRDIDISKLYKQISEGFNNGKKHVKLLDNNSSTDDLFKNPEPDCTYWTTESIDKESNGSLGNKGAGVLPNFLPEDILMGKNLYEFSVKIKYKDDEAFELNLINDNNGWYLTSGKHNTSKITKSALKPNSINERSDLSYIASYLFFEKLLEKHKNIPELKIEPLSIDNGIKKSIKIKKSYDHKIN